MLIVDSVGNKITALKSVVKYSLPDGKLVDQKELEAQVGSGSIPPGYYPFDSGSYFNGSCFSGSLAFPANASQQVEQFIEAIKELVTDCFTHGLTGRNQAEIYNLLQKNTVFKFVLFDLFMPNSMAKWGQKGPFYDLWFNCKSQLRKKEVIYFLGRLCWENCFQYVMFNRPSLKYLQQWSLIIGDEIFRYEMTAGSHFMFSIFNGSFNRDDSLPIIEFVMRHGADLNAAMPMEGTWLHILLANEVDRDASNFIKMIDVLASRLNFVFNYIARDGEGKTPLMIAVMLRQHQALNELVKMHVRGVDIGIDVPDNLGRTPLMLAAALGNFTAMKILLSMNADKTLKDYAGNGVMYYLKINKNVISDILRAIHVEPDRHCLAPHNWLYWKDDLSSPLVILKEDGSSATPDPEGKVMISNVPEYKDKIQFVLTVLKNARVQTNDADQIVALESHLLPQVACLESLSFPKFLPGCVAAFFAQHTGEHRTYLQMCLDDKNQCYDLLADVAPLPEKRS